jgi:hypothetical protein
VAAADNASVPALTAGVTALFGAVGGLTATGVLGRVERNEPKLMIAAVILVLLGSLMFVVAGLPLTSGFSQLLASLVGTGLLLVGIGWALVGGIRSAGQTERPSLQASLGADGTAVRARVAVANLDSHRTVKVVVDGLNVKGRGWDVQNLARYYLGPDSEGKVALPVEVPVPAGRFDAVGVKAWTDTDDVCSTDYSKANATDAGSACIILYPHTQPSAPGLALRWAPGSSRRVRVRVDAAHVRRRLVIVVAGQRRRRTEQLYRAIGSADASGRYRADVTLPVGRRYRRVCALARFEAAAIDALPPQPLECPIRHGLGAGRVGAELRQPRGGRLRP